jgi:hypothetical protein
MHRSLTAVVLCIFAQVAAACVPAAMQERDARRGAEPTKSTARAAPAAPAAVQGGELIKTAAAGTRDAPPGPRPAGLVIRQSTDSAKGEKETHSDSAMLLAALALMSAIALRRYGANKQ